MIRLYDYPLSGDCYKARQLLAWLKLDYVKVEIDFYPGFEHRDGDFLDVSPLVELPVIEDSGEIIRSAHAILVHIAAVYDRSGKWYPLSQPGKLGHIQDWLSFAQSLAATCAAARPHDPLFLDADIDRARSEGERLLRVLDEHLWFAERENGSWLCTGDEPTIADVACFPYAALCEEVGISQLPFPAMMRWIERFTRLDGFEPIAGMPTGRKRSSD